MTFRARPDLGNTQFKQLSGTTLTLSGFTQINSIEGLSINDGAGNFVPIILTGTTNYNVLTYVDGKVTLQPQSGGGSGIYSGSSPTSCSVGGLVCGTAINGCTISSILEDMLVPSILTDSICVATGSVSRQFGDTSTGSLCWSVTNNASLICSIYLSTNGTGAYNCTKFSGGLTGSTNGTTSYTFNSTCACPAGSGCTSTIATYAICAKTCVNNIKVTGTTITWKNKNFYFTSSACYSNSSISSLFSTCGISSLKTDKCLSISGITIDNKFFYYAYPKVYGTPLITVNGQLNNGWGDASNGTLFNFNYINSNGYTTPYYVIRSDNKITGTYTISII